MDWQYEFHFYAMLLNAASKPVHWIAEAAIAVSSSVATTVWRVWRWVRCKLTGRRPRQMQMPFYRRPLWWRILHCRRLWHCSIGLCITLLAGLLYHNPPAMFNHEFWELTAFGVHGLGIAPILKVAADVIGFEI